MYDVIVVGTRVAGASTAMLLARRGLRVLAVDRAHFPSDTVSTHQVQVPGGARLRRWGLLDQVIAAGTPPARYVRFDPGPVVLDGRLPELDGVDAIYSPRRTLLDKLLVDAARAAGAEVRERFAVDELIVADGKVLGISGRDPGGSPVRELARLVVGADGRHSLVARSVSAPVYRETPALTVASYTYWAGVPLERAVMCGRPGRLMGVWPTNDDLVMTYVAAPMADLDSVRADPEGNLLRSLDMTGDLGERIRAGRRAHRVVVTPDVPNRVRRPYGPGWALVGDAGLVMDPILGQGIGDAFRDAELLTDAVASGLDGPGLDAGLAAYQARRDAAALPMYEFSISLASFAPPPPEHQMLFQALAGNQAEIDRFLAVLTGVVPLPDYFAADNLMRLLGNTGMVEPGRQPERRAS